MTKEIRELKIYSQRCKGCSLCVEICPEGVLKVGKEVNKSGFQYVQVVHPEKCVKCGMCFIMCPDLAIEIK